MSSIVKETKDNGIGHRLAEARRDLGMSLQDVAEQAGCSTAYVHKLEQDRVRTPSPRVLAGLARALGLDYGVLMGAAGYQAPSPEKPGSSPAVSRFSNAHIVELLEALVAEVGALREELARRVATR